MVSILPQGIGSKIDHFYAQDTFRPSLTLLFQYFRLNTELCYLLQHFWDFISFIFCAFWCLLSWIWLIVYFLIILHEGWWSGTFPRRRRRVRQEAAQPRTGSEAEKDSEDSNSIDSPREYPIAVTVTMVYSGKSLSVVCKQIKNWTLTRLLCVTLGLTYSGYSSTQDPSQEGQ